MVDLCGVPARADKPCVVVSATPRSSYGAEGGGGEGGALHVALDAAL